MRHPPALVLLILLFLSDVGVGAEPIRLEPIQVSSRVWYVQGQPGVASQANRGFNSNAGFVVTDDGVVVIDALGTPALGEALLAAIQRITSAPVRRVIVTHYHADHFYGLPPFKRAGAEVWAHGAAREYLDGESAARLAQRRRDLAPWVDATTPLVHPDRWLESDVSFALGGVRFDVVYMGPAHAPDDVMVVVREEDLVFSGDLFFSGRVPFVGQADSRRWLAVVEKLVRLKPKLMIPGHGAVSTDPLADLALTREYLTFLREAMGRAVEDFVPFDEAYVRVDWSRFAKLPAFEAANRINAYGTYLLLERELLAK